MGQGVVQTFKPYGSVRLLEPYTTQVQKTDTQGNPVTGPDGKPVMVAQQVVTQDVPLGPAASQIAIKHLGTNGGGFYGQNSAHPFENPTPFSNLLEMFGLLIIPAGLVCAFGIMIGDRRHAWCIFAVMFVLLAGGFSLAWWSETQTNPVLGTSQLLEGKETRFGVMNSVLFATATTGTSCGAVNAMHDSFTPLAGLPKLALPSLSPDLTRYTGCLEYLECSYSFKFLVLSFQLGQGFSREATREISQPQGGW